MQRQTDPPQAESRHASRPVRPAFLLAGKTHPAQVFSRPDTRPRFRRSLTSYSSSGSDAPGNRRLIPTIAIGSWRFSSSSWNLLRPHCARGQQLVQNTLDQKVAGTLQIQVPFFRAFQMPDRLISPRPQHVQRERLCRADRRTLSQDRQTVRDNTVDTLPKGRYPRAEWARRSKKLFIGQHRRRDAAVALVNGSHQIMIV